MRRSSRHSASLRACTAVLFAWGRAPKQTERSPAAPFLSTCQKRSKERWSGRTLLCGEHMCMLCGEHMCMLCGHGTCACCVVNTCACCVVRAHVHVVWSGHMCMLCGQGTCACCVVRAHVHVVW